MMIHEADRFFHFSYLRQDVRGMPDIHELRDGHAFAELAMLLGTSECRYGGLLINYPAPAADVQTPVLKNTDLLVLTTRPPLSDDELDSRPIRRSGTALEQVILETVTRAFRICRRSYLLLSEEMAGKLPTSYRNRGEMEFTLNGPACYKRFRTPYIKNKVDHHWHAEPSGSLRTSAFVLCARMPNSAMLLNVFSMDGPGTLVWCYLLRTRLPQLVKSPGFAMVEIVPSGPIPERPPTLAFADNWEVNMLLDQRFS